MPIFNFICHTCNSEWEEIFTKASDVPNDSMECPQCGGAAQKQLGAANIRIGKVFTVGGPTVHDKDGHESLGMTGEQAEESMKNEADKRQFLESGKGTEMDFAINKSRVVVEE